MAIILREKSTTVASIFFFPLKNHSLENVSPLALLICWRVNFTFWALKIILYFWPLCGFIFSRLKEPKYLVHTEENCKLSKFDLELVGNCRSTNCRAGTTQKQNSMIYLIVVIHRHTQYIKAVFFPFFSFSWNNFPKKEFRRIAVARKGMGCKCCFVVFMCALRKKRVVIMVFFSLAEF